jgi:tetratricopeptide (TPR) repeat protein
MSNQALIELVTAYESMLEQGEALFLDQHKCRYLIEHYLSEEFFDRAMEVVEYALECYPFSAEFLLRKAEVCIHTHQESSALEVLLQAEILAPQEPEILLLRAQALTYLGEHLAAHEQLNDLPADLDPHTFAEAHFVRALIYEHQQEYEPMYLELKAAVLHDSEMRHGLEKLLAAVQHTRNYEECIQLHEQIIDENPYSSVAWYNLGVCHSILGNYEDALEALEFAYLADESFKQAYLERSDLAFELQQYALALDICGEIEQNFGSDAELLLRMGQCHLRLGHLDQAKAFLQEALKQEPYCDEIFYHLGEVALAEEEYLLAIHYCKKAVEIDDNREEYHATLAAAYFGLGDWARAETHYSTATSIAPEEAQYWLQYACFLLETEQEELALEVLDLAEESTFSPALLYCRIACLFQLGDRQEALLLLSEVLEDEYPNHPVLLEMAPELKRDVEVVALLRAYS